MVIEHNCPAAHDAVPAVVAAVDTVASAVGHTFLVAALAAEHTFHVAASAVDIRIDRVLAELRYGYSPSNMSQSSLAPNDSTVSMEYPENKVNDAMITEDSPSH